MTDGGITYQAKVVFNDLQEFIILRFKSFGLSSSRPTKTTEKKHQAQLQQIPDRQTERLQEREQEAVPVDQNQTNGPKNQMN